MDKEQVALLYGHYKWPAKKISNFLGEPITAIQMLIEELELELKSSNTPEELPELLPLDPKTGNPIEPPAYTRGISALKTLEVTKQLEFAPIIASIELRLLNKIAESVQIHGDNPNALAQLTQTFKTLTRDSMISTLVKSEQQNSNTNAPQVAIQVLTFRD